MRAQRNFLADAKGHSACGRSGFIDHELLVGSASRIAWGRSNPLVELLSEPESIGVDRFKELAVRCVVVLLRCPLENEVRPPFFFVEVRRRILSELGPAHEDVVNVVDLLGVFASEHMRGAADRIEQIPVLGRWQLRLRGA